MRIFKIDEQYLLLWCSACSYAFDLQSFKWFDSLITTLHTILYDLYKTLRHRLSRLHFKQI